MANMNSVFKVKVVLTNPKAANALKVLYDKLSAIESKIADHPDSAEYLGIRQDLQRATKAAKYLSRHLELSTES